MLPAATIRALTNPRLHRRGIHPDAMGQRRGQGEIRQCADEVHRQRIPPAELHETALPAPEQHVRAHRAPRTWTAFMPSSSNATTDKVVFLEQTLSWPHFGDPTFTFCDVERAVKRRLRAARGDRHLPFARGRRHPTGASSGRSRACRRNTESRTPPPDLTPTGSQPSCPPAAGRSACRVIPAASGQESRRYRW